MKIDMLMPQMGESITEATIIKWLKQPGESVNKDEIILEISTDKVDSEIPAPAAGVLSEILFNENDVVPVKEKIAIIDTESTGQVATAEPEQVAEEPIAQVPPIQEAPVSNDTPTGATVQVEAYEGQRFFSPVVKSLAQHHGVSLSELETIPGSGHGNRITKQDFLNFIDSRGSNGSSGNTSQAQATQTPPPVTPTSPVQPTQQAQATTPVAPPPPAAQKVEPTRQVDVPGTDWQANGTKIVPMNNMRKAIAKHMVMSKQTSPHVYSIQEVDVTNIAKWRAKYKPTFKANEGFNLSFTPFFLEAAIKGLQQFPYVNSSIDGNTVVLKKHVNLGCAVALGNTGLIVPVIKHAEEKNLVGVARTLNDLATRARNKKLMPDEVMDGTFTVTNPGVFGTIIGTPIINQPQVAILCLGAIEKRPVVINDMIAIRQRCYLTLSYDHRIVDGSTGGQFLKFVSEYLENWDMDRALY